VSYRVPSSRAFQPSFTLSLLYFFAFFFGFCFVLVAPELWRVLDAVPPGPEQQAAAREAARTALPPRLGTALGLAMLATGVGIWARVLPGLRRRA
jgi:hypothetical protein